MQRCHLPSVAVHQGPLWCLEAHEGEALDEAFAHRLGELPMHVLVRPLEAAHPVAQGMRSWR